MVGGLFVFNSVRPTLPNPTCSPVLLGTRRRLDADGTRRRLAVGVDGTPGRRRPMAARGVAQRGQRRPRWRGLRATQVRAHDDGAIGSFVRNADVSTQCPVVICRMLLFVHS